MDEQLNTGVIQTQGQEPTGGQTTTPVPTVAPTGETVTASEPVAGKAAQPSAETQKTQGEGADALTAEEKKVLSERTQKRIRQLVEERNAERKKREEAEASVAIPQTSYTGPTRRAMERDPQLQQAIDKLTEVGFVKQEDLKKEMQRLQDRMVLEGEHERLKIKYPGNDKLPPYDPVEIEEFMKREGLYNPEVAYKEMYEAERIQAAKEEALQQSKGVYSETPGESPVKGQASESGILSREQIGRMTPAEYEQNRTKILELSAKGKL